MIKKDARSEPIASKEHDLTITVYNPCGDVQPVKKLPLAPRLTDLKGRVIGVINNSKPGSYALFPYLEELLERNFGARILEWVVPFGSLPDRPEILNEILSRCHAVITGLGD